MLSYADSACFLITKYHRWVKWKNRDVPSVGAGQRMEMGPAEILSRWCTMDSGRTAKSYAMQIMHIFSSPNVTAGQRTVAEIEVI